MKEERRKKKQSLKAGTQFCTLKTLDITFGTTTAVCLVISKMHGYNSLLGTQSTKRYNSMLGTQSTKQSLMDDYIYNDITTAQRRPLLLFQGVRRVQGEYFYFNPLPAPRTLCDISGTAFSLNVTYMTQYENLLEYHQHLAYPSFISILCIPLCNKCLELNVSQIDLRSDGLLCCTPFYFPCILVPLLC